MRSPRFEWDCLRISSPVKINIIRPTFFQIISRPMHKILIIDDEYFTTKHFRKCFDNHYEVLTAENPQEAHSILKDNPDIKLILADQRMPKMTGTEFLSKVKKEYPEMVRILITGYCDLEQAINAFNQKVLHKFIQKPWNVEELFSILEEKISSRENRITSKNLKSQLQSARDSMEEFIIAIDGFGAITYANKSAGEILGSPTDCISDKIDNRLKIMDKKNQDYLQR